MRIKETEKYIEYKDYVGNKELLICKEQIVCGGMGSSSSVPHWSVWSCVVASTLYWSWTTAETLEVYFKHRESGWFKNRSEVWNDGWDKSKFQNIQCFTICIHLFSGALFQTIIRRRVLTFGQRKSEQRHWERSSLDCLEGSTLREGIN